MRRAFTLQLTNAAALAPAPGLHFHHCLECGVPRNCASDMCAPPARSRIAWCEHCMAKTQHVVSWSQDPREDIHVQKPPSRFPHGF